MDDFIFGTTDFSEQRLAQMRRRLGGVVHANRIEPLLPRADDIVTVWLWVGDEQRVDRAFCYYTTDGSDPRGRRGVAENGQVVALWPSTVEWVDLRWDYGRWWHCQLPPVPAGTIVRYRLEACSTLSDESVWADGGARFSYESGALPPPSWAADAIIYHIFVDRFYPGDGRSWRAPANPNGFFGGTLQGVIDKLDYIADLGATGIWLSPIFASPSYHGYDCTDYYTVEPRYGDNDTLRRLVQEAHARNVCVLLDFVPNHCSRSHPFFRAAQADRASPYYPWFTFDRWPDEYKSFFGVKSLPQFNLDYPPARQYIIDAACHWLKDYGIDGFRLDYALGPSHDFWTDFYHAVRRVAPEAFCIAEAVESPEVMRTYTGRMGGCLDFPFLHVVRQAFAYDGMDMARLDCYLSKRADYFSDDLLLGTFLDNHDMNRFLWAAQGDKRRLKLAALLQFTLPSPPIIYYGTEVGIEQSGDVRGPRGNAFHHHARTLMPWGDAQDDDLLAYYRRLADLRRRHPALRSGRVTALHLDAQAGTYAYACRRLSDSVIVALNSNDAPATITVPVAGLRLADGRTLIDELSGLSVSVGGGSAHVTLAPRSGAALTSACP